LEFLSASLIDGQALLSRVLDFYTDTLKREPEGIAFLQAKGLVHGELIDRFRLGYANRTLGPLLPLKNRKAGAAIRGQLELIGHLGGGGRRRIRQPLDCYRRASALGAR
jgi:hypothetical protein